MIKHERKHTDRQQVYEKMFNTINHQENANQNHSEISAHSCQNGCYEKENKQELLRMQRKGDLCTAGGNMGAATTENTTEVPQKIKTRTTM